MNRRLAHVASIEARIRGDAQVDPLDVEICFWTLRKLAVLSTKRALSWWRWGDSNPRPLTCEASALPAELHPHGSRSAGRHRESYKAAGVIIRPGRGACQSKLPKE